MTHSHDKRSAMSAVVAALPDLSAAELQQVQAICTNLLSTHGGKTSKRLEPDELVLYRVIVDALRKRHVPGIPEDEGKVPIPRLRGFKHKDFKTAYSVVESFIQENLPNLSKADRVSFYKIAVLSVVLMKDNDTGRAGITGILDGLQNLGEAIEHSFPGYLENGVLGFLMHGRKAGKKPTAEPSSPVVLRQRARNRNTEHRQR